MLDVHERDGALGARAARGRRPSEISSYGCVERRRRSTTALVPGAVDRREAEAGGRAVEPRGDRPLRVHARRSSTRSTASSPASAASCSSPTRSGCCSTTEPVFGRVFTDGRYDIGQKLDFLRANIELALDRADLGPELAEYPARARAATRPRRESRSIPLAEVQATILDAVAPLDAGRRSRCATRSGSCSRPTSSPPRPVPPFANTAMDGYAVRAADTAGASDDAPVRLRVVGELAGRARARRSRSAPGEAIRIMTGAPMPDGADAVVMVERTAARRRRRRARARTRRRRATTCAPPGGDVAAGERGVRAGHACSGPRTSACSRASTSAEVRVYPAAAGRRALDRRRAGRVGAARARARSATRTGRCCSRCSREAGCEPVDLGIGARRRGARSTATLERRARPLRRGASRAAACRSATTTS